MNPISTTSSVQSAAPVTQTVSASQTPISPNDSITAVQAWTIAIPIIATTIIAIIAWLIKNAIQVLKETDTRIEKKVNNIDSFTKVAANSIVEIQTLLGGRGFVINQRLAFTSGSPLKLTEYGETLMKESGFYDILSKNQKYFVGLVKSKNPQTNYDIQEWSMKVMKELATANDPLVVPLKNYAFNKGLQLDIILNSAGIVLRDEAMKEIKFTDATLE